MPTVYTSAQIASIAEQLERIQLDGQPLFQVRLRRDTHVAFLYLLIEGWDMTNIIWLPIETREEVAS